jgi:hypothetical protein
VTFGIEHLQGDEVLREGVQIVDAVILRSKQDQTSRCPVLRHFRFRSERHAQRLQRLTSTAGSRM